MGILPHCLMLVARLGKGEHFFPENRTNGIFENFVFEFSRLFGFRVDQTRTNGKLAKKNRCKMPLIRFEIGLRALLSDSSKPQKPNKRKNRALFAKTLLIRVAFKPKPNKR